MGGFLKWWYPATMGFPTKHDHIGVFWGYHHLRKHPYSSTTSATVVSWCFLSRSVIRRYCHQQFITTGRSMWPFYFLVEGGHLTFAKGHVFTIPKRSQRIAKYSEVVAPFFRSINTMSPCFGSHLRQQVPMAARGEPMLWRTMDKMLLVVDGDSVSNKKNHGKPVTVSWGSAVQFVPAIRWGP